MNCFKCKKIIQANRYAKVIEIREEKGKGSCISYISNQEEAYAHIDCLMNETIQLTCQAKEFIVRNNILDFMEN